MRCKRKRARLAPNQLAANVVAAAADYLHAISLEARRRSATGRLQRQSRLRFAEKPACIHVTCKSAGRNSSQVVDAAGMRTVIKTWCPSPAGKRKATRRRGTIARSLILLNDRTG
jgi:hypothetical protein